MKTLFSLRDALRDLRAGVPKNLVWLNIANKLCLLPTSIRDNISTKIYEKYIKGNV